MDEGDEWTGRARIEWAESGTVEYIEISICDVTVHTWTTSEKGGCRPHRDHRGESVSERGTRVRARGLGARPAAGDCTAASLRWR